jgi:hypothetical protein
MEELQDPGAVDGVVDGLPGLEVRERREAGVERGIISARLGEEKDAGRILDGQGLKVAFLQGRQVGPGRR